MAPARSRRKAGIEKLMGMRSFLERNPIMNDRIHLFLCEIPDHDLDRLRHYLGKRLCDTEEEVKRANTNAFTEMGGQRL